MRIVGLEPTRLATADFESTVSAIPPYPHIINYYIIVLIFCQVKNRKNRDNQPQKLVIPKSISIYIEVYLHEITRILDNRQVQYLSMIILSNQ